MLKVKWQQLPAGRLSSPETLAGFDAARESLRRPEARAERLIELLAEYEEPMIAAVMNRDRNEGKKLAKIGSSVNPSL
ncbi:MAG: hypothetical protein OXD30_09795 [Bryobacterales bacterium]|nr:hypothetical protein [Bryobacterales bacterium]